MFRLKRRRTLLLPEDIALEPGGQTSLKSQTVEAVVFEPADDLVEDGIERLRQRCDHRSIRTNSRADVPIWTGRSTPERQTPALSGRRGGEFGYELSRDLRHREYT
jgi:hypothetical protein